MDEAADTSPLRDDETVNAPGGCKGLAGGAVVYYRPNFLPPWIASLAYDLLIPGGDASIAWERRTITVYGRTANEAHDTAFYGDEGTSYRYSGKNHIPLPFSSDADGILSVLKGYVAAATGHPYNLVLMNYYRPRDSIGEHSDDERDLLSNTPIASISLGCPRLFILTPKGNGSQVRLRLAHGSLLVMAGLTQRAYKHSVPPEPTVAGDRVNLTYRCVKTR